VPPHREPSDSPTVQHTWRKLRAANRDSNGSAAKAVFSIGVKTISASANNATDSRHAATSGSPTPSAPNDAPNTRVAAPRSVIGAVPRRNSTPTTAVTACCSTTIAIAGPDRSTARSSDEVTWSATSSANAE
jgi:hypothetical protein